MAPVEDLFGPMRPPLLLHALSCVTLGISAAFHQCAGRISALNVVLTFAGGLTAHRCVNAFNEYFDFRSGRDARAGPTPFRGGSGTLPPRPNLAGYAPGLSVVTLPITAAVGLFFG